jgi:hypothetical protein
MSFDSNRNEKEILNLGWPCYLLLPGERVSLSYGFIESCLEVLLGWRFGHALTLALYPLGHHANQLQTYGRRWYDVTITSVVTFITVRIDSS